MFSRTFLPVFTDISATGQGGLEVRRDGARQTISLDLHASRGCRHGWDNTASADLIRRSHPHRRTALRDRLHHCQATHRHKPLRDNY